MYPILFRIGNFPINTYGVFLALAFLGAIFVTVKLAERDGLPKERIYDLCLWLLLSSLVGSKLLMFFTEPEYREHPMQLISLDFLRSGGVFYGGLILAVVVALWYIRRVGLPLWTTCDVFAPGIALGHVIGRFGCLFAGCCYGKPTTKPWGITFTDPYAASYVGTPLGVPLHPTQLYEAGAELLILIVLLVTERKGRPFAGRTFWLYMLLYAVSRFIIEFYRGDERGSVGSFSTSQFISVLLAPLAIGMLLYLARQSAPEPKRARRAA